MSKVLVVIDMQHDFVRGSLGSKEAQDIVPQVLSKVHEAKQCGHQIIYTRDTHDVNYLQTLEGQYLPVEHCLRGSEGWAIIHELQDVMTSEDIILDKPIFGSLELITKVQSLQDVEEVELIGVCTDICIVSNALLLKNHCPNLEITVDRDCCAGVTVESHEAALLTMKMCQVKVI